MKKKIIFICRSSSIYFVPENLIPLNFIKLGYEVIEINCDKNSYVDIKKLIYINKDAEFIFTYGRGCFPDLYYIIKDFNIPKIIWMPSIITDSDYAMGIVKNYLPCYDIVYTTLPTEIPLYNKLGVHAKTLYPAVDENLFKPINIEKTIELGFFGRIHYNSRKKLIEHITKRYKIHTEFSEFDYIELINKTKINFNMGYFNFGLPNRVFDVLSCGGFLLTPEYIGEDNIFENGKHLIYFNYDNIYDKIAYYLNNENECNKIGEQGRIKVINNHTYKNRIDTIIKDLYLGG